MNWLDLLVRIFGYSLGVGFLVSMFFASFSFQAVKNRLRINRSIRQRNYQSRILKNKWVYKYHRLLLAASTRYKAIYLSRILFVQALVFLLTFVFMLVNTATLFFPLITAVFIGVIVPVVIARLRVMKIRSNTQTNLSLLATELKQNYQKNYGNMMYAIKDTANFLPKGDAKKIFSILYIRLQDYEYRREAVEVFSYQLGESWGKNLGITILKSLQEGTDVNDTLNDLKEDITEFNKELSNAESSGRMIARFGKFTGLFVALMLVVNAEFFMQFNAYKYHFNDPVGVRILIISLVASFVGYVMAKLLEKPKKSI